MLIGWTTETGQMDRVVASEELAPEDIDSDGLKTVYAYWDRARNGAVGPTLRDFRLEDLPPKIVPSVVIVDFVGPPLDFHYRFFGTRMVEVSGMELTGKTYYADGIEGYGFVNARLFPILIETKRPLFHRTTWVSVRGVHVQTTTIRMPLSEDRDTATGAVTANEFRLASIDGE